MSETTRRSGELNVREMLRWAWRQLTSMRTALVLLLLGVWEYSLPALATGGGNRSRSS